MVHEILMFGHRNSLLRWLKWLVEEVPALLRLLFACPTLILFALQV
jgi:hypothetical protein